MAGFAEERVGRTVGEGVEVAGDDAGEGAERGDAGADDGHGWFEDGPDGLVDEVPCWRMWVSGYSEMFVTRSRGAYM